MVPDNEVGSRVSTNTGVCVCVCVCVCVYVPCVCVHALGNHSCIHNHGKQTELGTGRSPSPVLLSVGSIGLVSFFWVLATSFACVFIKGQTPLRTHKKARLAFQAAAAAAAC